MLYMKYEICLEGVGPFKHLTVDFIVALLVSPLEAGM